MVAGMKSHSAEAEALPREGASPQKLTFVW